MENEIIRWTGEDGLKWSAVLGIDGGRPCIFSLCYETDGKAVTLAEGLHPQFKVITGKRTRINPQREKGLAPGESLDYQWDTYSDDPMSRKSEVEEASEQFVSTKLRTEEDGRRKSVIFDGLTIGKFSGSCVFNFYEGSNLIRIEAMASTEEDGVAYLYHAGLDGFKADKL